MVTRNSASLIVLCALAVQAVCSGVDYYVDATHGNDRNTGLPPNAAWKTIGKVNVYRGFAAGDRILLKRGQIWREQLIVPRGGSEDGPLVIGAYGTGSRPVLKGSVLLTNWTPTGRTDCWRTPLSTTPNQVFFNGARGTVQDDLRRLDRPLEWAWSGGVLYVYATDNPDSAYTAPGIEASVRPSSRSFGLLHIENREHVTVEGLDVTQSASFGLYIKPMARYVTVQDCEVSHSLDGGLVVPTAGRTGAAQITVLDCTIHHNNGGFHEGEPGVATYHEGLTMENVDGFVIRRTRVYDNYMEGVNFKRGARNGLIEYCDLYSNDLINLYLEGATNIHIRYNRIYDCVYNAGIEFGLETSTFHNDTIRIHHNLFWGNSGAISFWAGDFTTQTRNITIDNSTFYNNEFGIRWKNSVTGNFGGTNYIRNNLFWPHHPGWTAIGDQTTDRQGIAQTTITSNVFERGAPTDAAGDEARIVRDAFLVSPDAYNFRLRPGSPCIDNGMDVGLSRDYDGHPIPQGQAPDVGAYEYLLAGVPDTDDSDVNDPAATVEGRTSSAESARLDEATAVGDVLGNIWVLSHTGGAGERQIGISRSSADFAGDVSTMLLTAGEGDHCSPAIAMDAAGTLYAAWQENARGMQNICLSMSVDGDRWSLPRRIAETGGNQANPAVAASRESAGHVALAWQDDRAGNQDVYVLASEDRFVSSTLAQVTWDDAEQTDPAVAIDSEGTIVVLWTDARNQSTDLYAAASNDGPWTNRPLVDTNSNQSQPAVAAGSRDRVLHLVWTDDAGGDPDVFYARLKGLLAGSVAGESIIDDTSRRDQRSPAVATFPVAGGDDRVTASWQDCRDGMARLYFADLSPGSMRANVRVDENGLGDD